MRRKYFSHGHIRTLVGAFGALFNKVYVANFSSDGTSIDRLIHVPIMYVNRSRITKSDPHFEKEIPKHNLDRYAKYYEVFPRMGFSWKGMSYAADRQLPKNQYYKTGKQYGKVPAPYNHSFELYILARDQSTLIQIIEQVLANFKPDLTVEIHHTAFKGKTLDVVIQTTGVSIDDTYADTDSSRLVSAVVEFELRMDYWPYVVGADIELGKFVECGGQVDYPIDPNWPSDDDDGDEESYLIEKVIVDTHDMKIFDAWWPSIDRTIITEDGVTTEYDPPVPIPDLPA